MWVDLPFESHVPEFCLVGFFLLHQDLVTLADSIGDNVTDGVESQLCKNSNEKHPEKAFGRKRSFEMERNPVSCEESGNGGGERNEHQNSSCCLVSVQVESLAVEDESYSDANHQDKD